MIHARRFFDGAAIEIGALPIVGGEEKTIFGSFGADPITGGWWRSMPLKEIRRGKPKPLVIGEPFLDGTFFTDGFGWVP